ncbi:hypothetical protein [Actinophytocola sp.]|uniref:hypothetical protein n=1 Tax=Actinophytocola sp. TaxID=1872138 RepID=UPI002ED0A2DD
MNLFTIEMKDEPGELAHLCETVAPHHVNLMMAGVTTANHGTMCVCTDDDATVRTALEGAGIDFTERPALRLRCPDQPGEAARIARKLANADVNIQALLPIMICQGEVELALSVDKTDEAMTALGNQVMR